MKKNIVLAMTTAAVIAALTGCGSSKTTETTAAATTAAETTTVPPSAANHTEGAEKILDDVQQHIGEDSSLERMTDIIEKRLLAEDYTSLELAAAFLKMAMGDDYEDIADEGRPLRDLDDLERRGGRNDRGRNGRRGKG